MPITPYLFYEDLAGAMKFLSRAFGLKKYGRAMRGKNGKLNHAAMKLGDDLIMMGYPGPKYKCPKRLGQATQNLNKGGRNLISTRTPWRLVDVIDWKETPSVN